MKVWEPTGVSPGRMSTGRGSATASRSKAPLETAINDNRATASFVSTSNASEEDAFESRLGFPSLLQVYAPITGSRSGKVIGAYEIYANPAAVSQLIGSRRRMIWLTVAVVFLALWAALALLVRSGSRRLVESNRLLEQSALDAVESLNADGRRKGPVHGRALAASAADRGRDRPGARPRGNASRRCASRGSSMTSGRSACPTRSS